MAKKRTTSEGAAQIRRRVEESLTAMHRGGGQKKTGDAVRLPHELQVRQIELELPNEELVRARAEIEAGLRRYSNLYEFAPVGYFTLGAGGRIRQMNLHAAKLLGIDRAKLRNWRFGSFVAASDRAMFDDFLARRRADKRPQSCEVTLLAGGQLEEKTTQRRVRLDATSGETDEGGPSCFLVAIDITDDWRARQLEALNRELEKKNAELKRQAAQLRALGAELNQAENRERRRLADLLHDDLQQLLAAANFMLSSLKPPADDPRLAHGIAQVKELLTQSIAASRSLTVELAPPILHHGSLADALDWLAKRMADPHGLAVEFRADAAIDTPADLRHMLYQSVRELLFNVVKHSGAKQATVTLAADEVGRLRLEVSDHGVGIPADRLKKTSGVDAGFGLFSVRERVESIGGTLTVASQPGQGVCATIVAPLPPASTE